MRGTRYGDFSRFHTRDGYGSVLMQQGRVQLDADWNAQVELGDQRLASALADLMGRSGAPASAPGFEVRPLVALELDGETSSVVFDSPGLAPGPDDTFTVETWLEWHGGPARLVAWVGNEGDFGLDIDDDGFVSARRRREDDEWDRVVAQEHLEHGRFAHVTVTWGRERAEVSIDGRSSARAHVGRAGPIGRGELLIARGLRGVFGGLRAWRSAEPGEREDIIAWWPFDDGRGHRARDLSGGPAAQIQTDRPGWRLVDLEVQPGRYYVDGVACELSSPMRYTRQPERPGAELPRAPGTHIAYLQAWEESASSIEDPSLREVALGGLDTAARARTVYAVRTVPAPSGRPQDADVLLDELLAGREASGRMRAEHRGEALPGNFLYRVEVHRGGATNEDDPTFKWSRRNGAETVAIMPVEPGGTRIELLPAEGTPPPFGHGDAIEVLDATVVLDGPPPPLLWVERVEGQDDVLIVSEPIPADVGADAGARPYVRRWHHRPHEHEDDGATLRLRPGRWIELEDGIRVLFEPGTYHRGDYWWIVARQDLHGIEWPADEGRPAALAPEGVERRHAPLALLRIEDDEVESLDLRGHIEPVVAAPSPMLPLPVVMPEAVEAAVEAGATQLDPEPLEPQPVPPPGVPAGMAVVGDAGDAPPGFAATGIEVITRRTWRPLTRYEGDAATVEGLAATPDGFVLATTHELLAVDHDGAVSTLAALRSARRGSACCVLDGRVFLVGGRPLDGKPDGAVAVYDIAGNSWGDARPLPRALDAPAVAAVLGRIHAAGGITRGLLRRARHDHWVYESTTDQWVEAPPLPVARSSAGAAAVDGALHVVGGRTTSLFGSRASDRHDVFDHARGDWTEATGPPRGGPMRASAGSGGELIVVPDDGGRPIAYERGTGAWEELEPVPGAPPTPGLAGSAQGRFVLAAGDSGGVVLLELPASQRWTIFSATQPV